MQTQKTIEYDVKTLLQILLDTMKSLRHADNVAYPKPGKLRRMRARVTIKEEPDEIRKRIKRGGYNVEI